MVSLQVIRAGTVFLALGSHLIFNRYEPSLFQFIGTVLLLECILYWAWLSAEPLGAFYISTIMLQCMALYLFTLGMSIAVYRLYFHPLRQYPGPLFAKLSKFQLSLYCRQGKSHLWINSLHNRYGEIIRIGPNDVSTINPDDVAFIQGGLSGKMRRGPWYDGSPESMKDSMSMARTRNVEAHKHRRRIWEQAFTVPALTSYEPKVFDLVIRLVEKCAAADRGIVDLKSEIDNFAFDAMGLLGFSRDYGMVSGQNKESKRHMEILGDYMKMVAVTRPVPWFKHIYRVLPLDRKGINGIQQFFALTKKRFEERYQEGASITDDIIHYLMRPESKSSVQIPKEGLVQEAVSVVVAGSDTTSICLAYVMYYLLVNHEAYRKLLQEIDVLWDGHGELEAKMLVPSRAPYLEGVINESLRLAEPDPNGNQRQTPAGGATINGKYFPGYTQLSIHKWSMHRWENNFSRATEFIPERWISDEERERLNITNHKSKGFIPFGAGQYGCVGKQLALAEMRLFIVGFLRRLDISPDPTYDLALFPKNTRSHLTLITPPLPVVIKRRKY